MKRFDYERYLHSLESYKIEFRLEAIRSLLCRMGSPQEQFPSIHIAGTNGKGSVSVMAAHMLAASGYNVGLYTSPHLVDIRERLACFAPYARRPQHISSSMFSMFLKKIFRASGEKPCIKLTYFEAITGAAFLYFAKQNVDIAVLEVGMGGRLDATNVVHPCLSIITPIAYDHTEWLGSDLRKIAGEKAGIIKSKIPCITAEQSNEVWRVIKNICREKSAPLYRTRFASGGKDQKAPFLHEKNAQPCETFSLECGSRMYRHFRTRLLGRHQADNAALALSAVHFLRRRLPRLKTESMRKGLLWARWPGRFDIVKKKPLLIVDGAHNPHAFRSLVKNIQRFLAGRDIYLIMAILDDKDSARMCRILLPHVSRVVIVKLAIPRFRKAKRLAKMVKRFGRPVEITDSFSRAFQKHVAALKNPGTDVILVAGSLYLAGEVYIWAKP